MKNNTTTGVTNAGPVAPQRKPSAREVRDWALAHWSGTNADVQFGDVRVFHDGKWDLVGTIGDVRAMMAGGVS